MPADLDRLNLLLTLGRHAEGEKAAREAIAEAPGWAAGYGFLALFLSNQGQHLPAIRAARDCVGKDPHDAWGHAVRAAVLHRHGRTDQALPAVREALRLDPTYAYAYRVHCEMLCAEKRFRDARRTAHEGLEHHPTDEMLLHWKGWAEYMSDRLDAARRTAENGLKHHPDSASLRNVLACALMDEAEKCLPVGRFRRYRRGDAILREAIRLDPTEKSYQDNRRNNALRCRRAFVKPLLMIVMLVSVILTLVGMAVGTRAPAHWVPAFGAGLLAASYLPGLVLINEGKDWFLLSAPLGRLGFPAVPLEPEEERRARVWWRIVLAGLFGAPVAIWLVALLVRL
jgi:tetratricopeptide (TPR) repeat protein